MSSFKHSSPKENLFNTFIIIQDEGEETEAEQGKSSRQNTPWTFEPNTAKKDNSRSIKSKIKRYFE